MNICLQCGCLFGNDDVSVVAWTDRLDETLDDIGMDQTMLLEFTHFGMKAI